jgi:hypothetical protein
LRNFQSGSESVPHQIDQGQVYGPYLELKDERILASTDGTTDANGDLRVFMPGEAGYSDTATKVIVDYWGNVIRYYPRLYSRGSITAFDPRVDLTEIVALRPWNLGSGATITATPDAGGDNTSSTALKSADFALFSPGADRRMNKMTRADQPDEFNKDNIVEVGP